MAWLGPDGALGSSILIRTFVADGERLTLHVGGGITWRSDPADEWDETVAKARGPLSSIGAVEVAGVSGGDGRRFVWVDGELLPAERAAHHGVRPRVPAGRRDLRDAPRARRPA